LKSTIRTWAVDFNPRFARNTMDELHGTISEPPIPVLIGSEKTHNPIVGLVSLVSSVIAQFFLIATFVTMLSLRHLFQTEEALDRRGGQLALIFIFFDLIAIFTGIASRRTKTGKYGLIFSIVVTVLLILFIVIRITFLSTGIE
jgi:hypothetical protein